jgi:hypothetical protein
MPSYSWATDLEAALTFFWEGSSANDFDRVILPIQIPVATITASNP